MQYIGQTIKKDDEPRKRQGASERLHRDTKRREFKMAIFFRGSKFVSSKIRYRQACVLRSVTMHIGHYARNGRSAPETLVSAAVAPADAAAD